MSIKILLKQKIQPHSSGGHLILLMLCLGISQLAFARPEIPLQTLTVSGTVTSATDGGALPGVNIIIKGTSNGTVADVDGSYTLNVPDGNAVLVFSFVGYETQEVTVNNRSIVDVTLNEDVQSLEEVVVTGYMTQKKADLTGAVAVVTEEELNKSHGSTNVLQSLQGVVPGMRITSDGNPTGNVGISIRGQTSVNGASPLIVIDGVPTTNFNLRDLNSGNIASIQVLKDAASASIYGAQGAGGVILIETKKGQAGAPIVRYQGSVGVSRMRDNINLMNTEQYGRALWQASVNDGQDPNIVTQIYDYDWHNDTNGIPVLDEVHPIEWLNADQTMPSANTDWIDAISQLGLMNNHQITVSGGSDKSRSLLSLNYYKNEGTQIHTFYERYSVRFNSSFDLIKDRLTIGENVEASRLKISNQNSMHSAMVEPPIVPVHTTDGGWGGSAVALGMGDYWNPVRELTLGKDNNNKYNKLIGNVYVRLNFLKNFNFKTQVGLDYTEGYHRNIQFTFEEGGGKFNSTNSVNQWYWFQYRKVFTNTLNYTLSLDRHELDVIAGMETNEYNTETTEATRQDLQFESYDYAYLDNATGNQTMEGHGDSFNFVSYFTKFNYVFDTKYLLSASLRYDGSSKFGKNNRYGLFPAFSAGWRLSDEPFLSNNNLISNLKLRASWGKNGNSNIATGATTSYFVSDYDYTSYAIEGNETGNNPSGYLRERTGNDNLKWETTVQTDIGIDFGFFDEQLTGTLDYYHKETDDMLFEPPYLGTIGEGGRQWVNAADMSNDGVELILTYRSDLGREFQYSMTGNVSYNKNRIDNLPASVRYTYGGSALKGDDIQGLPLHSHYGFIAEGIFKSEEEVNDAPVQPGKGVGRIKYRDISGPEGVPDGVVDYNYDRTWLGNWDPKFEFGYSFQASFKNFDFSMFWQGIAGITVHNGWKTYSDFWNVWVQSGFNHPDRILDAWSPANPDSEIPALSLTNPNDELRNSTYFMESGSYLKLRNVEVGYTLPAGLINSLGIKSFRVYFMAENVINIHKWWGDNAFMGPDPETPSGGDYDNPYTRPQIFKLGVDVSL